MPVTELPETRNFSRFVGPTDVLIVDLALQINFSQVMSFEGILIFAEV